MKKGKNYLKPEKSAVETEIQELQKNSLPLKNSSAGIMKQQ